MSLARDVHYIKVRPGTEGIVMHHPQTILILWLLSHSLSVSLSLSSLYQFSSFALSRNAALKNQIIRPKSLYSQIETNQQKWGFPCGFVSNCLSPADFPLSGESEWTVMHVVQPTHIRMHTCLHIHMHIHIVYLCISRQLLTNIPNHKRDDDKRQPTGNCSQIPKLGSSGTTTAAVKSIILYCVLIWEKTNWGNRMQRSQTKSAS